MNNEKLLKIENFLGKLGETKSNEDSLDGFYIICKKCGSQNTIKFSNIFVGSEYTGTWGDAGIKCVDCGNAAEIASL